MSRQVLRNMKSIYIKNSELERSLSVTDRILMLVPNNADEVLDRADIYRQLACFRAAFADYCRYLQLVSESGDAHEVRRNVIELQGLVSHLN